MQTQNEAEPETITKDGITFVKSLEVMRGESKVWEFVEVFNKPAPGTRIGTKIGRTIITADTRLWRPKIDPSHHGFFKLGISSNITQHFRKQAHNESQPLELRIQWCEAHTRILENSKGGHAPTIERKLFGDGQVQTTRFLRNADRRPHHLRQALAWASSHIAYNVADDKAIEQWLEGLNPKVRAPQGKTVRNHQVELYAYLRDEYTAEFAEIREAYHGLSWAHMVTDMWTEKHSRKSYSSLAVRCVDVRKGGTELRMFKLGISLFTGKHTARNIQKHLVARLDEFGLKLADVQSMSSDSGANVRKAGLDWTERDNIDWLPCILHCIHNAAKEALGLADEKQEKLSEEHDDGAELDDEDGDSDGDSEEA